jgi:carbon-monoxide dehydrogenase medium subunit
LSESGGQAKPLAGGTDLLVQIKQRKLRPKALISLRNVSEISSLQLKTQQGLRIGSMTPLTVIESSEDVLKNFDALAGAVSEVASLQVRSRATLGGNLCNAAPSADMAPILIAYGANVVLFDGAEDRIISLEDFFTGPGQTVLKRGELMKEIQVPIPQQPSFGTYQKARRSSMDIAVVGVGILVVFDSGRSVCRDLRLVLGAVAPTPIHAREAEKEARGQRLDDETIKRVSKMAAEEACPISDVRSSASYRRSLVQVLTRKSLQAAQSWAQKGGAR